MKLDNVVEMRSRIGRWEKAPLTVMIWIKRKSCPENQGEAIQGSGNSICKKS
jgi:hypothetical protein